MSARLLLTAILGLLSLAPAHAAPLPPPADADARTEVDPSLRALAWPLPPDAAEALRAREWSRAVDRLARVRVEGLSSAERLDHAFVMAWALVRAGRADEAWRLADPIRAGGTAPAAYRAVLLAEIERAQGRRAEALAALDGAGALTTRVGVRAEVLRAEILRELGRTADETDVLERLAARPDPAPGGSVVLWALARRRGLGSEEAYPLLRRVWAHHPGTDEARAAEAALGERYPGRKPTFAEALARAAARAEQGAWGEVLSVTEPFAARAAEASAEGCQLAYLRMRALYRRNELTAAADSLGDGGSRCVGLPGDEGAKLLYVAGEAWFRKGQFDAAAKAYAAIPTLHPSSTMADDGLVRAGIAHVEAGRPDEAVAAWQQALDRHPSGDTTPEAAFRLAFARYDAGRTADAIAVAERLGALDPTLDEVHVPAGRYWAARWRAWPDVRAPNARVDDPRRLAEAVVGLAALVRDRPYGYYAALAWSRLVELSPETAQGLAARGPEIAPGTWRVRATFLDDSAVRDGVALARIGLVHEALDAWSVHDLDRLAPDEVAWLVELRTVAGDWLEAHARMHRWLRSHPLGTLGPSERAIVALAFPDRYGEEVRAATASFPWPARLYHALVREESLFNARVVSHAGAKGLGQLMPGTARDVAARLGVRLADGDLFDPAINTRLGAAYFDQVLRYVGGNPCLAMAAYNAGPGRVDEWTDRYGNLPLDEWVERIPFRETRGYVKRVTSTWQTMHHHLDVDRGAFIDLTKYVRAVKPGAP